MKADYKIWLDKAEHDLNTAKVNFNEKICDAAAFYSHQASEKALKAFYIKRFGSLKKTHDLVLLSRELNADNEIIEMCKELTPAYTYTRYPDAVEVSNIDEISEKLLKYAEEVLEWVKKKL